MSASDIRGEEISELLQQIQQRVRARYPSASVPVETGITDPVNIPLADLIPLMHARDAAQAKMASIGSVNPRAGGLLNKVIQVAKKAVARSLGWFVRDQITFNRQTMACVESTLEALNEVNRSISVLASQLNAHASVYGSRLHDLADEASQLKEMRHHWQDWRTQWEHNLSENEMRHLRAVADLQTGYTHRVTLIESNLREMVKGQHDDYLGALDRANLDLQKRFWADLEKVRLEYERLIHNELRLLRQRAQTHGFASEGDQRTVSPAALPVSREADFDYGRFADRFRGTEDYVRRNQQFYIPLLRDAGQVLDIGCGRGEFLDVLREHNIPARGIDLGRESVDYCRSKGLMAEQADLFEYLAALPRASEDAIFSAQVVEHLNPANLPAMIRLCASRLRRGGILAIETPNPECLAIFATHFFLDPTHTRPVPSPLLAFYMEESALGHIEVHRLSPAVESFPSIQTLPSDFAERFFGGLDYAITGVKL